MFYGFKQLAYYLNVKNFVVQIDFASLTYTGDNQTPIIVRHMIFMQSFVFTVHRIPSSELRAADHLSCNYLENDYYQLMT